MGDPGVFTGLCGACIHAKHTRAARGSEFMRCLLASTDPRFVKYPRLPMVSCPGFERAPEPASEAK